MLSNQVTLSIFRKRNFPITGVGEIMGKGAIITRKIKEGGQLHIRYTFEEEERYNQKTAETVDFL